MRVVVSRVVSTPASLGVTVINTLALQNTVMLQCPGPFCRLMANTWTQRSRWVLASRPSGSWCLREWPADGEESGVHPARGAKFRQSKWVWKWEIQFAVSSKKLNHARDSLSTLHQQLNSTQDLIGVWLLYWTVVWRIQSLWEEPSSWRSS